MYDPISNTWPDYMETVDRKNKLVYLAVGVPGNLKAWCQISKDYGKLGLDIVIQPAIRFAESGFPASQYLVDIIRDTKDELALFSASAEVFLPGGVPPKTGDTIQRNDFAKSLKSIAANGEDALYNGQIGETVVKDVEANGGIVSENDLSDYQIHYREPVRGTYRGYQIVAAPPTSSGGTHIVQMLNLLEEFDIAGLGFGTADYIHLLAEVL